MKTVTALVSDFEHGVVRQGRVLALFQLPLNLVFDSLDQIASILIVRVVLQALWLDYDGFRHLLSEGVEVPSDHPFHRIFNLDITAILGLLFQLAHVVFCENYSTDQVSIAEALILAPLSEVEFVGCWTCHEV